jgi:hypothetical protein
VAVSEWSPATEVEVALREALGASDQEQYFRVLSRTELLLPVSTEALAGRAPMGWGTWTTGNRTHVLAFTSAAALQACLNEPGGTFRKLPFHELAADWPNYEWWLAVNPGLPIEAYLPSWFVSQLTRGNIRLPGRTMGARARMAQSELAAALNGRVRAAAPAPIVGEAVPGAGPPAQAHVYQAASNGYASEPVETVEAEIIDYPPATGAARVYTSAAAEAPPEPIVVAEPAVGRAHHPSAGSSPRTGFSSMGLTGDETLRYPPPRARDLQDAEVVTAPEPKATSFAPANDTEVSLLAAVEENNTDSFLSTLLLARVILPVPLGASAGVHPRDRDFPWRIEGAGAQRFIALYTSPERLADHTYGRPGVDIPSISLKFVQLIAAWPDEEISFAINPGSPVGATLPGSQIVALAAWATEVGLRDEPTAGEVVLAAKKNESRPSGGIAGVPTVGADRAIVMQRTVPPAQLPFYLERGYDRVSGFVNRASEVSHLTTPRSLYRALGLTYRGSPFSDEDGDVHVLRWVAHRSDLYRLPYGGQHEAAMRAMQGWVIERAPFRGNGFAPGETDVVAEFKVDSVRLPHGAQMWRLAKDGTEALIATFDADNTRWVSAAFGSGFGLAGPSAGGTEYTTTGGSYA